MKTGFRISSLLFLMIIGWLFFTVPVKVLGQVATNFSIVGPADKAVLGPANVVLVPNASGDFITIGQNYRIRQNGTIRRVKIYTANNDGLVSFYLTVWRKNGLTFDLVGQSENLANDFVSEDFSVIDLNTPITNVLEGDYYGYSMEWGSAGFFFWKTSDTANTYFVLNSLPEAVEYDWLGNEKLNPKFILPIELYMDVPDVVFIGDSIISGYPSNHSFLETTEMTDLTSTIESQFENCTQLVYQNMGIPAQTTTQIAERFLADAVALNPSVIVADGGINDIVTGGSLETFMGNWTFMLDEASAQNIVLLVQEILPCSKCNEQQLILRDQWNLSLRNLVSQYKNASLLDSSEYVGQFRQGGQLGNLWDINPSYDIGDGVHYDQNGNHALAFAIAVNLGFAKKSDFTPAHPSVASCSLMSEN